MSTKAHTNAPIRLSVLKRTGDTLPYAHAAVMAIRKPGRNRIARIISDW